MERRLFEDLVESDVVSHEEHHSPMYRLGVTSAFLILGPGGFLLFGLWWVATRAPEALGMGRSLALLAAVAWLVASVVILVGIWRRPAVGVSATVQWVIGLVFVVVPILASQELPEVATTSLRAFFAEPQAAPPPPPPPPPPAPRAANVTPRVTAAQQADARFTAPIDVPDDIRPDEGMDLGVDGGVAGGVEGGVAGGVVGGIVGGLPTEPPPTVAPVRVGGQIKEPRKLKNVQPNYPPIARQARVQGQVVLECTISPAGRVTDVRVVKGIPLLDTSAIEAVKQWVYTPTLLNGVPVPVIMTVTVNFTIS